MERIFCVKRCFSRILFFSQTRGPWIKTVFCGWSIHTHLYPHLLPTGVYLTPSLFPWSVSADHWFKGCNQQTGQHYLQVKKQSKWNYWLSVLKCCFWLSCNAHVSVNVICLCYDNLSYKEGAQYPALHYNQSVCLSPFSPTHWTFSFWGTFSKVLIAFMYLLNWLCPLMGVRCLITMRALLYVCSCQ